MKPFVAILDSNAYTAKSLALLLEDHGCDSVVGADWIRLLGQIPHVSCLDLIIVEEWSEGDGLASALALRGATGRTVPILILKSGYLRSTDLGMSVPAYYEVHTPTSTERVWASVRNALGKEPG